ncbi:DUF4326 domain-containing protein [Jiangella endophytica]|uniref:DUF4326 domain-containing protein n=1 Tax=Jiangella endophytica TaxID=1623398 RepID=UPI000E3555A4
MVVARPTAWGNPFRVGDVDHSPTRSSPTGLEQSRSSSRPTVTRPAWAGAAHRGLGGRDLACWCPLDRPCHTDVLLSMANGDRRPGW